MFRQTTRRAPAGKAPHGTAAGKPGPFGTHNAHSEGTSEADVDAAVTAARRASGAGDWPRTSGGVVPG